MATGATDLLWAGGGSIDSSTMQLSAEPGRRRVRARRQLGNSRPAGLGVAIRRERRRPHGSPDAWRERQLCRSCTEAPGGPRPPVDTGIALPSGTRDLRGADINGDGLGDIVWSEIAAPHFDNLQVHVRYAMPAGGYGAPATLYSQWDGDGLQQRRGRGVHRYPAARRPRWRRRGRHPDERELLDRAHSASGYANDRFDTVFPGGVALDFNDDDCADYAYKHLSRATCVSA